MQQYKKSAKDLAFEEKENKYKKQIRLLESELKKKDNVIKRLEEKIDEITEEVDQLKDWISRLLEYTDLSEDEMRKIIKHEKEVLELREGFLSNNSLFKALSNLY